MYLVNTRGKPADSSFLCPASWAMVTRNPASKRMFLGRELFLRARLPESREVLGPLFIKSQQIRWQGRAVEGPELS